MVNLEWHDKGFRLDPVNNIDNSLKYFLNQSSHFRMINFLCLYCLPKTKASSSEAERSVSFAVLSKRGSPVVKTDFSPIFPPINETDKQGG